MEVTQWATIRQTLTDKLGQYHLEELLPGDYSRSISKNGWEPTLVEGMVTAGNTTTLKAHLTLFEGTSARPAH